MPWTDKHIHDLEKRVEALEQSLAGLLAALEELASYGTERPYEGD